MGKPVNLAPGIIEKLSYMNCHCGGDLFIPIFKLKYVSPLVADVSPMGATHHEQLWRCITCGSVYPYAMAQDKIDEMRKKLEKSRELNPGHG